MPQASLYFGLGERERIEGILSIKYDKNVSTLIKAFSNTIKLLIVAAATVFFKPFLLRLVFKSGHYLRAATIKKFKNSRSKIV